MGTNIEKLQHVRRSVAIHGNTAQITVLNTGALIGPEAEAMLQALLSRSVGGFDMNFAKVVARGAKQFMQTTYVGYGHRSVGDGGSITLFIENVSMLCAKAFQDWQLYCGQESSTRYIDFSKQPFVNPAQTTESKTQLEALRSLYLKATDEMVSHLTRQFPRKPEEKESVYEKAIKARAFDITRSLLPAGASTILAVHMNIRQIADQLMLLRHHPLEEVRCIATAVEDAVSEAYPNSFGHKRYEETERYNQMLMRNYYYMRDEVPAFSVTHDGVSAELLGKYRMFLYNRPPKTELPRKINECGTLTFEFGLDFGSFRDVQRHRNVIQQMPLVTAKHEFEQWYLDQMPTALVAEVQRALTALEERFCSSCRAGVERKQYYIPMGYVLPNRLTGGLHALVYLAELRSGTTVHPTLQVRARQMAAELTKRFGIQLHIEGETGRFDIRRGEHDIVERAPA